MIHEYYKELQNNQNIRENLSLLRSECKDPQARETLLSLVGDGALLTGLLESDEPKVRINAALLLGSLGLLQTAGSLFHAYEREQTLFVRSAYLTALSGMEVSPYLEALKEHRDALLAREIPENEKKHVNEELRELERIITAAEGITRHTFVGFTEPQDFLLATNREQRGVTLEEVKAVSASVRRSEKLHPLGVLVHAKDVRPFASIRTYRELLFPVRTAQPVPEDAVGAAEAVWDSNLRELLTQAHRETTPFYFRLEIKSHMPLDKKSTFARRFSAELERLSGRMLVNAPSDYEIELRLLEKRDGGYACFLKLLSIAPRRFAYRKNAVAASIHPATAAMLVALAEPYLKENAQILDPFCGVGTMLIERDIRVPAREKYGIDIFGEAIRGARENASYAGEKINFINRDYFDFTHAYLFDEIITNMPVRGRKSKEETDAFYGRFFEKSAGLLKADGILVLYSNEQGFIRKQLRIRNDYRLLAEQCIREKDQFYLFVIQYKG